MTKHKVYSGRDKYVKCYDHLLDIVGVIGTVEKKVKYLEQFLQQLEEK